MGTSTINEAGAAATKQFCTFHLAGRLYGVNILDVKEVTTEVAITPIFHAPAGVKGYVNIRGHVHLVLDLKLLLGFENMVVKESCRVVLLKPHVGDSFGILVERIGDVVRVEGDLIQDRRRVAENKGEEFDGHDRRQVSEQLIKGVCKLEKSLLVVLEPRNFLRTIEKT